MTCTGESIFFVTMATGTGVATGGIGTVSISATEGSTIDTFIYICNSNESTCLKPDELLTNTV